MLNVIDSLNDKSVLMELLLHLLLPQTLLSKVTSMTYNLY